MKRAFITLIILVITLPVAGQFSIPGDVTSHYAGKHLTADFDQDGDLDLVGSDENLMWFRNDGNGAFEKILLTNSWICNASNTLAVGDMNNDNFPDIVYHSQTEAKTICFLNDGNGGVGNGIMIDPNNDDMYSFSLCDIDNDGDLDIAGKLSSSPFTARIYRNMGNTVFEQSSQLFDLSFNTFTDIDADGDTDLFLGSYGEFRLCFNDGTGNFDDTIGFDALALINQPYFRDLDLDGYIDILDQIGTNMRTFLNPGNWDFGFPVSYPLTYSAQMAVEDINYDGYEDVLITDNSFGIYYHGYKLNNGDGTYAAQVSFNLSATPALVPQNSGYSAIADFDNNGFLDFITGGQLLFKSDGPLSFESGVRLFNTNISMELQLMDVNDDGIEDLVYATSSGMVYQLGQSNGTYLPAIQSMGVLNTYASMISDLAVADFNQDGKEDLFYCIPAGGSNALKLFVNDGDGTFTPGTVMAAVSYVSQSLVTDLDGDGFPDVVYMANGSIRWVKNQGDLTFAAPVVLLTDFDMNTGISSVDIEGDGDNDVVYTTNAGGIESIRYLPNNGNGTVGLPDTLYQEPSGNISRLVFGDVNADGNTDMVFNYWEFQGTDLIDLMKIVYGDGLGNFAYAGEATTSSPQKLRIVDMNNDDLADLVILGNGSHLSISFQDESGQFADAWYPAEMLEIPVSGYAVRENKDLLLSGVSFYGIYLMENNLHHLLRGELYVDLDGNDQNDASDIPVPYQPTQLLPANLQHYTNTAGKFLAPEITEGTNELIPPAIPYFDLTTLPASYVFQASSLTDSVFHCAFGYTPNSVTEAIDAQLIGSFPRCNTIVNYWIDISNTGTTHPSGVIGLELDSLIGFVSSPVAPDSVSGQHIYWHYDSLGYFGNAMVQVLVQMPDFNSMGDTMVSYLTAYVTDSSGTVLSVYADSLSQVLACAYDPNDKTVEPAGIGALGYIPVDTEWMEYTVRFQNTGNDTAITVVILDELDADLDPATLTPVASSFPAVVSVSPQGLATFAFNDIHLPDSNTNELASHGFIRYRIRTKENLSPGIQIQNTARIYFDYNPAIITNTVVNTLYDCDATVTYTLPESGCVGIPLTGFVASELEESTISWTIGTEAQTGPSFEWEAVDPGTYTLTVVVANNLCSRDTTTELVVSDFPVIGLDVFSEDTLCSQDGAVTLPAATPAGGTWTGNGITGDQFNPVVEGTNILTYTFTNDGNCSSSDSLTVFVENCLGLEMPDQSNWSVHPNPFTNTLTITFGTIPVGDYVAEMYSVIGERINVQHLSAAQSQLIQLPELNAGVYVLRIVDTETGVCFSKRIIRE